MNEYVDTLGTTTKRPGQRDRTDNAASGPLNSADSTVTAQLTNGKVLSIILTVYCLLVALAFHETLISMVAIWIRSETFAHGFLILPISLWLTWRMRDGFSSLRIRPQPLALLLVLGAGFVWLVANLVDVLVVQQLAFVAVLVSGIWTIAGTAVVCRYAFPLGFLFLAVPMGEGLIPPLMELTADTTEAMVRGSGIPIFREGMYLNLPSGTWSVIEECSGVRYLIASVTLGLCYAHLTYNSLWRQLAFIAAAIVLPILANSLRAYAIVMVGHLSDMRLGIGADHLVFGWVFFGVVMLLLFWIGGFWREDTSSKAPAVRSDSVVSTSSATTRTLVHFSILAVLCASIWPAVSLAMIRDSGPTDTAALSLPENMQHWQAVDGQGWFWRPGQQGADRTLDQVYRDNSNTIVGVHLRQYLQQHQGVELVDDTNPWRPNRRNWRVIARQKVRIDLGQSLQVDEVRVVSAREDLLLWSWYQIDGHHTASPYIVKLLEAKQQILAGRRQGTRVFIATPIPGDIEQARQILQDFVNAANPSIEASLGQGLVGRDSASEPAAQTGMTE